VVIGIIAVLIGILMPSMNAARKQARTTQCLSNVRQIGVAFQMYVSAHRGKSVHYSTVEEKFWMEALRPFNGDINTIGRCPEASEPSYGWGSAFRAWGPDTAGFLNRKSGSYAFNGWLYYMDIDPGYKNIRGGERYGLTPRTAFIDLPVSDSARVPAFVDSGWVDAWPTENDPPGDLVSAGNGTSGGMPRVCLKRHNKKYVNVVFLDGHADTVVLPDLWKLKWSNRFKSRDIRIPGI
jgi:prepilin-type processing-associated H-X9-DG protein